MTPDHFTDISSLSNMCRMMHENLDELDNVHELMDVSSIHEDSVNLIRDIQLLVSDLTQLRQWLIDDLIDRGLDPYAEL